MNKIFSLVIPTYNEADTIAPLCAQVEEVLTRAGIEFEIIIVDDNSPDGTWKIAADLALGHGAIRLIRRMNEKGLATAVLAGWAQAEGEILGVIDGDLQHPPETLARLLKKIFEDRSADIVIASRYVPGGGICGWGPWRRFISQASTVVSHICIPRPLKTIRDPMSGYFVLRKKVIEGTPLSPIGYKILLEVLAKGAYAKAVEVPYIFQERIKGNSKAGLKQCLFSLFHIVKLGFGPKSDAGIRIKK